MKTADEKAETVCKKLNLPLRGIAFVVIRNALKEQQDVGMLVKRLHQLNRYSVGKYDEGDGHMCSYQDISDSGDWISVEELYDLLREFSA